MHLTNWKARRAGGRITVNGTLPDGTPGKIVGVDVIVPGPREAAYCVATDKNGVEHHLAHAD